MQKYTSDFTKKRNRYRIFTAVTNIFHNWGLQYNQDGKAIRST